MSERSACCSCVVVQPVCHTIDDLLRRSRRPVSQGFLVALYIHSIEEPIADLSVGVVIRVELILQTHQFSDECAEDGDLAFVWLWLHGLDERQGLPLAQERAFLVLTVVTLSEQIQPLFLSLRIHSLSSRKRQRCSLRQNG